MKSSQLYSILLLLLSVLSVSLSAPAIDSAKSLSEFSSSRKEDSLSLKARQNSVDEDEEEEVNEDKDDSDEGSDSEEKKKPKSTTPKVPTTTRLISNVHVAQTADLLAAIFGPKSQIGKELTQLGASGHKITIEQEKGDEDYRAY